MSEIPQTSSAGIVHANQCFTASDPRIAKLYDQAKQPISKLQNISHENSVRAEDECDQALEQLAVIGGGLAEYRAAKLCDVICKISVWRALTQEDALETDQSPVDERLLLSIIRDIECLVAEV